MNQDNIRNLAQDINAGLRSLKEARNVASVARPSILDEQPPAVNADQWQQKKDAADVSYTETLLNKATLTPAEQTYLANRVNRFLRDAQ
jgi:hypothetical protein